MDTEKIDIDRLHSQPKLKKGDGKTFGLIVECLQNIDFSKPGDMFVWRCHHPNYIRRIIPMFIDISKLLEIEIEKIDKGKQKIFFKDKGFLLFSNSHENLNGYNYIEFIDYQ